MFLQQFDSSEPPKWHVVARLRRSGEPEFRLPCTSAYLSQVHACRCRAISKGYRCSSVFSSVVMTEARQEPRTCNSLQIRGSHPPIQAVIESELLEVPILVMGRVITRIFGVCSGAVPSACHSETGSHFCRFSQRVARF